LKAYDFGLAYFELFLVFLFAFGTEITCESSAIVGLTNSDCYESLSVYRKEIWKNVNAIMIVEVEFVV